MVFADFIFYDPDPGLALVLDGLNRFGSAFFDKQARGQKWQVAMASTYSKHIIICGLGKTGYRTALELLKFGREVIAIERNEKWAFCGKCKRGWYPRDHRRCTPHGKLDQGWGGQSRCDYPRHR